MYGVPSEEVRPKVVNKDDWEYDTECLDGPPTGCEFEGPQPELALPMISESQLTMSACILLTIHSLAPSQPYKTSFTVNVRRG